MLCVMITMSWLVPLMAVPLGPGGREFAVVLDAGSSSTKIRAYSWDPDRGLPLLEDIKLKSKDLHKSYPGIGAFGDNLPGIPAYIADLLGRLKDRIPQEAWSYTPVYFMATAGLRLLDENVTGAIMQAVAETMAAPAVNPFRYEKGFARILSGEEEALYAWITVNYLNGYLFSEL